MKKKLNCVLLVDDDKHDNFFHNIVLEDAGIANQIKIAINGREALDLITSKGSSGQPESMCPQPELIFLDLNMPVMDGWEFLEEYQKTGDYHHGNTVIIILTTSLNPADEKRAEKMIKSGCYLNKPLTLPMIDEVMLKHFPDHL